MSIHTDDLDIALEASVVVDVSIPGKADVFIDDIITIGLRNEDWQRLQEAAMLALHTIARPVHDDDPLPRESMIALNKLASEGGLSETITVLGWTFHLRPSLISLPLDKINNFTCMCDAFISSRIIDKAGLTSLVGKLNWVTEIQPLTRYFLNRLRFLESKAKWKGQILYAKEKHIEDVQLMKRFLQRAHDGISINNVMSRHPNKCLMQDASPFGMGGCS